MNWSRGRSLKAHRRSIAASDSNHAWSPGTVSVSDSTMSPSFSDCSYCAAAPQRHPEATTSWRDSWQVTIFRVTGRLWAKGHLTLSLRGSRADLVPSEGPRVEEVVAERFLVREQDLGHLALVQHPEKRLAALAPPLEAPALLEFFEVVVQRGARDLEAFPHLPEVQPRVKEEVHHDAPRDLLAKRPEELAVDPAELSDHEVPAVDPVLALCDKLEAHEFAQVVFDGPERQGEGLLDPPQVRPGRVADKLEDDLARRPGRRAGASRGLRGRRRGHWTRCPPPPGGAFPRPGGWGAGGWGPGPPARLLPPPDRPAPAPLPCALPLSSPPARASPN